ncbi:MAG TPA: HPF/RaiA family ribosome-associated protein [Methylomirabilota bacterium]|nr:HPF/RaiA family ribosome-associated protein [Methylomirabilota bacterium]
MKIGITYRHVVAQKEVEDEIQRLAGKLSRLLKTYSPDLVQLHGVFSKNGHGVANACSLNLSLPTGTLHATATNAEMDRSCREAFAELESQVKKHKSRVRRDYVWKRKRRAAGD